MKNSLKIWVAALLFMASFASCSKDENKVYYEGGTAPVLNASSTAAQILKFADKAKTAVKFNWTNPNYSFNTGISTQDVTYILQIDTVGANFTNPKKFERSVSKELSTTFTVAELNNALLGMDLVEDVIHNMEMRVISSINGSVPLVSNVLKMSVTPFLDVVFPVPAKLYITGGATPASWMGGGDAPNAAQQFTKISSSEFQLNSIALKASDAFLFVPVYGDWGNKYGFDGKKGENNVNGDSFKPNGEDISSPASAGNYKVVVSFKTGKYTLTKL